MRKEKGALFDIIRIAMESSRFYAWLILIQRVILGLIPSINVIAIANFVNVAQKILKGDKPVSGAFIPIIVLVSLVGIEWVIEKTLRLSQIKLENAIRAKFRKKVTGKIARLKYKYIEDKDTWDLIMRVTKELEFNLFWAYHGVLELMKLGLICIGMIVILTSKIWWSGVVVGILTVPLVLIAIKSGKKNYSANRLASEYERKSDYLKEVLTGRDAVAERTLFGYTKKMGNMYYKEYEIGRKIKQKSITKRYLATKSSAIVTSIISLSMILVLIPTALKGAMTIGMFMGITNGLFNLVKSIAWTLNFQVQKVSENCQRMVDINKLLALDETEGAFSKPCLKSHEFNVIEFKDVTFTYPNTDVRILNGMSFKIEKGKNYAFVGGNGAGKTTVTKLLTGLYTEYEGEILVDGREIRSFSQEEQKAFFSVVYQDFARYFLSVRENIELGNINQMESNTLKNKVEDALKIMDLQKDIDKLPDGLNTPLGKIKADGQDLSGGQWQRLAMARTLVSDAPLRILDEPTAALDPISESRMYEEFHKIGKEATTIFISHRLGSTKLAQKIFVLANGRVAESGSHQELLDRNGIYTEMYESQRSWYDA